MKFNHLFYDSNVNFKSISKKKIVLSILLGLLTAITLYSFYYVLRETDRLMFLDFENRPTIISEADRELYNLFFASISMIIGNSIAISFLFSHPQKMFSRRNNKRTRILNDQAFLGPSFIHWFTKVWFLFGLFASQFMGSAFITNFMWPSILLMMVLYLDSWKTLILVIKRNRWKIQIVHCFSLAILTLVLSRFNVVDYKSFDELALTANPTIDVPSSFYEKDNYRRYYDYNHIFKMDFITKKQVVLFTAENKQIEFYDLYKVLKDYEKDNYYALSRVKVSLRANKDIPIKYIKDFELKLLDANQWNLIYEVANDDESTSSYYNNQLIKRISPSLQETFPQIGKPPRIEGWDYYKNYKFKDTLKIYISNRIEIENEEVPLNMLSRTIKNYINKASIIEYIYSDSVTYQDYINVLSAHKTAVWELRAAENYDEVDAMIRQNQFVRNDSLLNERRRLVAKYPFRITERFE